VDIAFFLCFSLDHSCLFCSLFISEGPGDLQLGFASIVIFQAFTDGFF